MRKAPDAGVTGELRIEYLPLSALLRAPRNPKEHDLGAIGTSYARFGYVAPMVLDERTGKLVAGHGRLDALQLAKASGGKAPDRVKVEAGTRDWLVPVVRGISFPTDAAAEAYLVADNRLAILGGWDDDVLAQVLPDLAAQDALVGTGFDGDDVDALLASLRGPHLGPELDESIAEGVSLCVCGSCGHEHHRMAT